MTPPLDNPYSQFLEPGPDGHPVPVPQPHLLFSLAGSWANSAVTVAPALAETVVDAFVESAMVTLVPDRVQHTKE